MGTDPHHFWGRRRERAVTGTLDNRLVHRFKVQDLLAGFRAGDVTPDGLPSQLSRLRREVGRVLIDTLFQELRGEDHKDRHLATVCLQIIADDEVETMALDMLRRPATSAHTRVGAIEILETLGYSQDDLLPQIPYPERPSIAEAMLENYILLVHDPLTLGGMLSQFLDLPPEQKETYLEIFADSGDPRVVDFLWHVAGTGDPETRSRAFLALDALRHSGVQVGAGPQRSLVSLLEEEVGQDISGPDLREWGNRCVRDGDLLMAEACLRQYVEESPPHGSAMLQLATILASQGRDQECSEVVAVMEQYLGPRHFQVARARDLLGDHQSTPAGMDEVERALEAILGGLIPTTPHLYHMAILMWNHFIRSAQSPISRIADPLGWAVAVTYNLRRVMGMPMPMPLLAARVGGLGRISSSSVLARARRMRDDLDLIDPDDGLWLEKDLAARVLSVTGEDADIPSGFPDWTWLGEEELDDLRDYGLWVALYRFVPGVGSYLEDHHELRMVQGGPGDENRQTFDWQGPPRARPYSLGPDIKARFLVSPDQHRLAIITLSRADLHDAMGLLEAGAGNRTRLEQLSQRPLFEIAGPEMVEVARGHKSGFDLEVRLDMVDLDDQGPVQRE